MGWVAAIALTIAVCPAATFAATPSPADWRDVVIYQIITDRYYDGDPSNNNLEGEFDPADGFKNHGGDFAGIEQKLDYLSQLGVNGIWISPVVLNTDAQYHGFAARDFFSIAPHFGGLADLQSLVAAAHARGIFVIIDIVCNHMGTLIGSNDPGYPSYQFPGTYGLSWHNPGKRYFGVFDDLSRFHAHGHVQDFNDPEQILGELFGLDDLKTEDPVIKNQLVLAAEWLMSVTDCDGYRIDTVKHVEMDFWNDWSPEVHAHGDSLGKNDFFLFGEVFTGDDAKVGSYTGTQSGGNFKLDSVLDFPLYNTTNGVFLFDGFGADPGGISGRYSNLGFYDPTSRERLVTFLDNHDVSRFLRAGPSEAVRDESRLRAALGFHLTARGVPVFYYGTEQVFDGGGDPFNREDMWDGLWDFGPSDGDNFDMTHPMFRYSRALLEVRNQHEALRRGVMTERYVETSGPGLYVFERETAGDTVLVAVNTSNLPVIHTGVAVSWPAGTVLVDELEPAATATVAGGTVDLEVPARGVRIMASQASMSSMAAALESQTPSASMTAASAADLQVESMFPGHDQSLNDRFFQITVTFDGDVLPPDLNAAFQIAPAIAGEWIAIGNVAHFHPFVQWSPNTEYHWSFDATLQDQAGRSLPGRFEAFFRTVNVDHGIVVPFDREVDRLTFSDLHELQAPEGLIAAPWIHPQALLLTDTALDRIFTLTPGSDLGHFLGDDRWDKSEGLARSASGVTAVIDENGVFEFDATRMTALVSAPSGATLTGAGAYGSGTFGQRLFMCDPQNDRIVTVEAGGVLQTFATGINGGEGLAFGPGGAWGTDLYVSDADLTSLGTPADGTGRIARVASDGTVTTFAQSPLLLHASALVFDTVGHIDGNLLVADIVNERVLRVDSLGNVFPFALGFNNLSGSHCLAIGADGALYVADPGSGQPFSNTNGEREPQVMRISKQALVTDAPAASTPPGVSFAPPSPNPSSETVRLSFTLPRAGRARLDVYDLAGRRVDTVHDGMLTAGVHALQWAGTDASGRRVGDGLYFVRLSVAGERLTRRVAILR